MLTFQDGYIKTQRLAKDNNPDVLAQLKQDWNTGYHMFNAKLARYYSRKQQFTNIIANQSIYQVPIDCVRIMDVTVLVTGVYQPPLKQVRSEFEWRQIVSYPLNSNWPSHYFIIGNDEVALWPTPSQAVTNGLRFIYQPQDHDLSLDDVTSTSTGFTINIINGQNTVTANGAVFTPDMVGLWFQLTGVSDLTWYQIVSATTTVLTLQSAFVGTTTTMGSWRVGQCSIIPQEYDDAPMHYALGNYFAAQGDLNRSTFHLGSKEKPGMFYQMITDCLQAYSSSSTSSVISGDEIPLNLWLVPPPAGA